MAPKSKKSAKQTNSSMMRGIYWTVIIGIVAIVVIVTLEAIIGVMGNA
ncbi:hypothetical protein [Rheinheimera maricola]|uniref:DUF4044 domain-containing protein n=1 Tax=Rheinheimera maricola TaxID=2793282 RepID=A0ABS7X591_9GAMM|nr:hypothetical protein [Rheinheimera maricola]MBZ9610702.1 hypothetical protein [Rheinheimera maricola]